jgi:serpin B
MLSQLGMPLAFSSSDADFSGMTGKPELFISDVIHKAFIAVDEAGTEAAAATAVIMKATSAPQAPVQVTVDKPFIFLIRDNKTDAILFIGRVLNPSE